MEGGGVRSVQDGAFRRIVAYMWVAVGIAVLQLVWVFGSRYLDRRLAERQRQEEIAKKYQPYAGKGTAVKILQFYATPGVVDNAAKVRIEPQVEALHPALSHCFWVTLQHTTTYQLLADGSDGTHAAQSLTVKVE
jgi:hypothetical protein